MDQASQPGLARACLPHKQDGRFLRRDPCALLHQTGLAVVLGVHRCGSGRRSAENGRAGLNLARESVDGQAAELALLHGQLEVIGSAGAEHGGSLLLAVGVGKDDRGAETPSTRDCPK